MMRKAVVHGTETVDSANSGWYTSIALDSGGNPHISYYDTIKLDLMYATIAALQPRPVPEFDLAIPIITSIATAMYLVISKRYKK